jgi:restriction system protein
MAIPDFQTMMQPILGLLADDQEHGLPEIRERMAEQFSVDSDELQVMLPSGRGKLFATRVGWATTYLYQTKLLERPRRSMYRITPRGHAILSQNHERIDLKLLSQFEELQAFRERRSESPAADKTAEERDVIGADPEQTPEEQIHVAYTLLRNALATDVLARVKEQSPAFFEQLVLDVLRAMGYGGSREDAVERLGQTGDEGVDGVIREDELGLDLIYVQAKRWQNPVGRPEIQKFFGALHGKRASKGVVGVTSARKYEVKRIDLDYFGFDDESSPEPGSAELAGVIHKP